MKIRTNIVKTFLLIAGIIGYAVLLLPWYELTSEAHVSGFSSSYGNAGTQMGLVTAYLSVFGYALYVLPGACIAMGLGIGSFTQQMNTRGKALAMELIGLAELVCLILLNNEMASYGTSISGDGYSASSGFYPVIGYYVAVGVYILTGVLGFILMIVAPKPQDEEKEKENTPVV